MSIIKKQIKYNGQTAYINFSLNSNNHLIDFQQEINNLAQFTALDMVNPVNDAERRRFIHIPQFSQTLDFWFRNSSGVYVNCFEGVSFTNNEIQCKKASVLNSFFILDYYDSYDVYSQCKIFSTYLTKITDGTCYPTYVIGGANKNQFSYLPVPLSYINAQTTNSVTGYTKLSFYSGKDGSVKSFYLRANSGLTTSEKMFVKTLLNISGQSWQFLTKSNNVTMYQIAQSYTYDNKMSNSFCKCDALQQNYPINTLFNPSTGTYISPSSITGITTSGNVIGGTDGGTLTPKSVFFSNVSSTCPNADQKIECTCGILRTSAAMAAGDCYFPAFSWVMAKPETSSVARISVEIKCNNVLKEGYYCVVSCKLAQSCNGTWNSFCVDSDDIIHVITCAEIYSGEEETSSYAYITLDSIKQCVGSYELGSTTIQTSHTCNLYSYGQNTGDDPTIHWIDEEGIDNIA